ncbi:periplasmic chaperone for outer membrane proteins Skp [Geoalkalibacter ferrihydriticus]|uniref:Membrane protein n=2 Tax=Geoalkalibacter ferrihydriticus TaxID=392333 RepID=A0A0C2HL93_9BACT|nr:OmpH family outer membrane protein [Geoalkalibacter ferrihydriticus]KIH75755.1 membrane protein [Geoalkalibacter ferrihydriticus DSM 17813]SDM63574.1 periplasmic chaperone for outer membrane proteins Skp [Geoalkalibacter ferrihydriticus]
MKRITLLMMACLLALATPALAQNVKIGYVDLQRALNLSSAGVGAKEEIAKKVREYEGQVSQRQDELRKLKEELERQAVLLSEDARSRKEREYQQKLRDFQRFTKDIQDELQQKDAELTRRILEDIFQVIGEYGAREAYTVILEKTESSLLYAADHIDLTDRIIEAFNARARKN